MTEPVYVDVCPPAFSWESQAAQYAPRGLPGIRHEQHMVNMDTGKEVFGLLDALVGPHITVINCLLHRDDNGDLDGILNHYDGKNPLEAKDNINVWVRPDRQRRGIATRLIIEAKRRWPGVRLENQRYTPDGLKWLESFLKPGR